MADLLPRLDSAGSLPTRTYHNSSTNTFTHNGLDTRVGKVDSGGTKTFLRDGAGVTAPVLSDGAANYTPAISERRSSTTTYTHTGFKNAESQTGSGQTVLATQTFDAFGNLDTSSGTWKGPFGYGAPFGYQSDADSGLMLLGHRYYDSSTGRFLTRDPAKHGRNWFSYCANNAPQRADPSGLAWHPNPWQGDILNKGIKPIIVVGEPGKGRDQEAIMILPGQRDPRNFDVDDIGTIGNDGKWHWYHNEIEWPYTSSGDLVYTVEGKIVVLNSHTAHIAPIPDGSGEYGRLERIRNGGGKPKGVWGPKNGYGGTGPDERPPNGGVSLPQPYPGNQRFP